ncbi:hypothetical protein F511_27859 [Dorcoceras hygrometricum]|uniref:Uncharacterized protein n=1 Tax=Dorcoceras hygrometricum TaxID=472368 RepID=A0A2Z7BJP5_9LAMI|nr:hypothetical protein F511_27859 [Dorcoceras hygrometricum]
MVEHKAELASMQRASQPSPLHALYASIGPCCEPWCGQVEPTGPGGGPSFGGFGHGRQSEGRPKARSWRGRRRRVCMRASRLGFACEWAGSVWPVGRIENAGPLGSLGLNGAGDDPDDFIPIDDQSGSDQSVSDQFRSLSNRLDQSASGQNLFSSAQRLLIHIRPDQRLLRNRTGLVIFCLIFAVQISAAAKADDIHRGQNKSDKVTDNERKRENS